MKKLFTLCLLFVILASVSAQKKKIAYVVKTKTMDASACTQDQDPVIKLLSADANFEVTYLASADATYAPDLSSYDIIIVTESWGSGDAIVKSGGSLQITGTKPMIYNKCYSLQTNKALGTGPSKSNEGDNEYTVIAGNENNVLFNGITLTNGAFVPFFRKATDAGGPLNTTDATKNKATNGAICTITAGTMLAQPTLITTNNGTTTISINDAPAGTVIEDKTTAARIIFLGMNYGAMCADGGTNMTSAGLTLWRNAAYILAGLTVPTTPVVVTSSKSNFKPATVTAFGGEINISVDKPTKVVICSIDGKIVKQTLVTGEDFIPCKKGMYIVKVAGQGATKVVVTD